MSFLFYAPWLKSSLFVVVFGLLFGLVWLSLTLLASQNFFSKCYPIISCRLVVPVKLFFLVSLCSDSCSSKLPISFVSCRLIKSYKISCQVLAKKVFVLITHHETISFFLPMKQFLLFMTDIIYIQRPFCDNLSCSMFSRHPWSLFLHYTVYRRLRNSLPVAQIFSVQQGLRSFLNPLFLIECCVHFAKNFNSFIVHSLLHCAFFTLTLTFRGWRGEGAYCSKHCLLLFCFFSEMGAF